MSESPLVSVILPTRNRAELLRRSVASVLGQSYANLELIVVNDASTDHTLDVLKEFALDPRLRCIHRPTNHGAAAARNAGIREARGTLIAFQDDDDVWLVEKLARQVDAMLAAPQDVGLCLCGYIRIEPSRSRYFGGSFYFSEIDYSRGNGWEGPEFHLIATPAWLVRRTALDRAGLFDERIRSWDDWELGLRLQAICRFIHVDEPLFIQDHIQGSSLMKAEEARGRDMQIIMEKHGAMWAGKRDVLARHYYCIGRAQSLYGERGAGRPMLRRSLRLNPWKWRSWAALAVSYMDQDLMRSITRWIRAVRKRLEDMA